MKYQYLFILQSDTNLGEIDNPEMEITLSDFLPVKCYGKMNAEIFEKEWNNGTRLVNQEREVKEDFINAFKPILESMIAQGVIITNEDGTYSQRPHSKSLIVNLVIDSINHFLTNFKIEEELHLMHYKQAKELLDKHNSTWNKFKLSDTDYQENKELVDNYEPSFFNTMKGQMLVSSVKGIIPMVAEAIKGNEGEADIRLDPVQFFGCVQHLNGFFSKYMDRIMQSSPEIEAMFKSMNIPMPKLTEPLAKVVKLQ